MLLEPSPTHYSAGLEPQDPFFYPTCDDETIYGPVQGESYDWPEVRAKACAIYLNSLNAGKNHGLEFEGVRDEDSGLVELYVYRVKEEASSSETIAFDSFWRDNEEIAKKVASDITASTGKTFIAKLEESHYFWRNSWTVVPA